MYAALNGCRESVETLLLLGADPDILTRGDTPALFAAIQAGDMVITERLTTITTKGEVNRRQLIRVVKLLSGLSPCMGILSREKLEMTRNIRDFIQRYICFL